MPLSSSATLTVVSLHNKLCTMYNSVYTCRCCPWHLWGAPKTKDSPLSGPLNTVWLCILLQVASSWADIGAQDCADWCYLQLRKHLCSIKQAEEDVRQQLPVRKSLQKLLFAILQGNILFVARQGQQVTSLSHTLCMTLMDQAAVLWQSTPKREGDSRIGIPIQRYSTQHTHVLLSANRSCGATLPVCFSSCWHHLCWTQKTTSAPA